MPYNGSRQQNDLPTRICRMSTPTDLNALLELDPASFAAAVDGQPESVKRMLHNVLQERLEKVETAAWGTTRAIRGHKAQFDGARYSYDKLEKTQQWLAAQFHKAFEIIYADPAEAAAAAWAYEQQHGAAQTGRMLNTNPELFGKLRGFRILGFSNATRTAALKHAQTFDFVAYRLVFNLTTETGQKLLHALKETARVANG
jgi:hypothetical protein